jgi:hypothetical protein
MGDGVLIYFGYPQAHEEERLLSLTGLSHVTVEVIRCPGTDH